MTFGHRLVIMELGALDLFEQHCRYDGLLVLSTQSQAGDDVGLRRK
jgi:hypothetical protein